MGEISDYRLNEQIKIIEDLINKVISGYEKNIEHNPDSEERYGRYIEESTGNLKEALDKLETLKIARKI